MGQEKQLLDDYVEARRDHNPMWYEIAGLLSAEFGWKIAELNKYYKEGEWKEIKKCS